MTDKKKVMVVFGTRPEALKMVPLVKAFQREASFFETFVCVTAQHREMLDQVLSLFDVSPHCDLDVMTANQSLSGLTARLLPGLTQVMEKELPDVVFVQGDTTTTFVAALAAFYLKIPVAHIEAGLRTADKYSPFPEEINRRITSVLADYHYPPTDVAAANLIREGISEKVICKTGNTVIDALKWVIEKQKDKLVKNRLESFFKTQFNISFSDKVRTVLVTGHRRENFGQGFDQICQAISDIAGNNENVQFVYPVHLNPNVQKPVYSILGDIDNVFLIPPLDYEPFSFLMKQCYLVMSDSGGIQEEAPFLGKPVLVLRNTTERPEGIRAGTAKLVGTNAGKIRDEAEKLLNDKNAYRTMAQAVSPYGDGLAGKRIVAHIKSVFTREGRK